MSGCFVRRVCSKSFVRGKIRYTADAKRSSPPLPGHRTLYNSRALPFSLEPAPWPTFRLTPTTAKSTAARIGAPPRRPAVQFVESLSLRFPPAKHDILGSIAHRHHAEFRQAAQKKTLPPSRRACCQSCRTSKLIRRATIRAATVRERVAMLAVVPDRAVQSRHHPGRHPHGHPRRN